MGSSQRAVVRSHGSNTVNVVVKRDLEDGVLLWYEIHGLKSCTLGAPWPPASFFALLLCFSLALDEGSKAWWLLAAFRSCHAFHPDVTPFAADAAALCSAVSEMLLIKDLGLLVTASLDARIHIWDLTTHSDRDGHGRRLNVVSLIPLRLTLVGHTKGVSVMTYIPSQRYLISASYDRSCLVCQPPFARESGWV